MSVSPAESRRALPAQTATVAPGTVRSAPSPCRAADPKVGEQGVQIGTHLGVQRAGQPLVEFGGIEPARRHVLAQVLAALSRSIPIRLASPAAGSGVDGSTGWVIPPVFNPRGDSPMA